MGSDVFSPESNGTHNFVGMQAVVCSAAMRRLLAAAERIAATPATVLITGETGVGKEIVARAIHHYSLRSHAPWVDVSCTTLPEHLVESELFGFERGAFSGAGASKPGLFELAAGGTLFLDEVGDLDRNLQGKLLRVLDGVPYYRLGGTRKVPVDVRVVAATNRNLEKMTADGRFRADLYHRLAQCRIEVPPLRERREAIIPLASFFLSQSGAPLTLEPDAVELLLRYSWPGNVRELRNVITRAAVLAAGDRVGPAELGIQTAEDSLAALAAATMDSARPDTSWRLEEMERRHILQALEAAGGRQVRAAGLLGISRRTLGRKLKQYARQDSLPRRAAPRAAVER